MKDRKRRTTNCIHQAIVQPENDTNDCAFHRFNIMNSWYFSHFVLFLLLLVLFCLFLFVVFMCRMFFAMMFNSVGQKIYENLSAAKNSKTRMTVKFEYRQHAVIFSGKTQMTRITITPKKKSFKNKKQKKLLSQRRGIVEGNKSWHRLACKVKINGKIISTKMSITKRIYKISM